MKATHLSFFIFCLINFNVNATNLYLKGGLGLASSKIDKDDFGINDPSISSHDTGLSLKGGVGIRLNKFISIEAGGLNHDLDLDELFNNETFTTTGKYYSIFLAYPNTDNYHLTFQIGKLNWKTRVDPGWTSSDSTLEGNDYFYGVGIISNINKKLLISADLETYPLEPVDIVALKFNIIFNLWL